MQLDGLPQGTWSAPSVGIPFHTALVEEAVDLAHRGLRLADVGVLALAAGVAGAFEAPCQADLLVTVLGDLDVLSLHHGRDGGVPSIAEASEQDGVGMGVEGGLGPSPLTRGGAGSCLALLVDGCINQTVPVRGQQAERFGPVGEHLALDVAEGGHHASARVALDGYGS